MEAVIERVEMIEGGVRDVFDALLYKLDNLYHPLFLHNRRKKPHSPKSDNSRSCQAEVNAASNCHRVNDFLENVWAGNGEAFASHQKCHRLPKITHRIDIDKKRLQILPDLFIIRSFAIIEILIWHFFIVVLKFCRFRKVPNRWNQISCQYSFDVLRQHYAVMLIYYNIL